MTEQEARKEAQRIIAQRAYDDHQDKFAEEVLSGAWDETNRSDILVVMTRLLEL
jgi:hypothetical protein